VNEQIDQWGCDKQRISNHETASSTSTTYRNKRWKSGTRHDYIRVFFLKVCMSVHHCTVQINHKPDATIFQFIILTFIYSSTCFERFPNHHQELNDCISSLWFFSSYRGDSRAVFVVGPARPRTQHDCHHDTKVKPEVATEVIELLMMGGKMSETC
jgi:hypothetical protein